MMPSFALVKNNQGSRNAFHFGVISVAGFGVDYPQDSTFSNAILTPQPPAGMGFGGIDSSYAMMKAPIGMSRIITDRLSIGASVVPALSMLHVAPAPFSTPVSTDGGLSAQYPLASRTAKAVGLGADVGLHYQLSRTLSVGVAYHSPIHFEAFHWNAADRENNSHRIGFRMDMPELVSMGAWYSPASGTLLAVDARRIDYANTRGFAASGFNPDGSVAGFGWRNIWTVGGGIQQKIASKLAVRLGYHYRQNPIPASLSFFNVSAPAIAQHHITAVISRILSRKQELHLVYYHVFRNKETGPYIGPQGPVPGCAVTNQLGEDSVAVGFTGHL